MMGLSASLVKKESGCCGGKTMPSGCCENKVQRFEIKDDYLSSFAKINVKPSELTLFVIAIKVLHLIPHGVPVKKDFFTYSDHSPPDQPVSLSILYRSILI